MFSSVFSTISATTHFLEANLILYLPFGFIFAKISSSDFVKSITAVYGVINFL
jgi:hypothetical protein